MDKLDRMSLIRAEIDNLNESMGAYAAAEFAAYKAGRRAAFVGDFGLTRNNSKTAIKRRIVQLRDDLLALEKEMDG